MAKILIVDDDKQVIQQLTAIIEKFGHEPFSTVYSKFLFDLLAVESVDLIIMDVYMPDVDGISLLKELKAHPDYRILPVIMLTGDTDEQLLSECFKAGAADFITKPLRETVLHARLGSVLSIQQYIEDLRQLNLQMAEEIKMRNRLENRLRQTQKMEALGTLAGGIAHEFNNLLFAMLGYVEMARDDLDKENPIRPNLEQVLKAGHRAKDLVQQILTFSRQNEQGHRPIQLVPLIKEALKLIRAMLPTTIEIKQNFQDSEVTVLAEPTQMHQVLMNLCGNAGYAMREKGGVLEVALQCTELKREAADIYNLIPGKYIELSVQDEGEGIVREIQDRIFEPFFTTKPVGEGTGMGLAVVHGIVQSHNGAIQVHSKIGEGSKFQVLLPQSEVLESPLQSESNYIPAGKETIMVIDDEETLVDMLKQMLSRLGYRVLTASKSEHALEIFTQNPLNIDLVITDQTMPKITGLQLARQLRQVRKNLPVILITGYSERVTNESMQEAGIFQCLEKPVTIINLAKTVREALDG